MTLGDIATKARALTHSDTTTYTDANLLIDINIWYQKVADMIFNSQDDSDFDDARNADYPVQTTPMIASQRDYPIAVSEKMLKIKRVDMTFDGTNWYRAEAFDTGGWPYGLGYTSASTTDANFDANFSVSNPKYDFAYGSIWVMPMPTADQVAAGAKIRVEWFRSVTPFTTSDYTSVITDSTVVPGFDSPFHPILAFGAAYEFALANALPQLPTITQQLQDLETRMRTSYGKKNLDTRASLTPDYGNTYV